MRRRRWTSYVLPTYTGLVIAYLFVPILVMIAFGFNNPKGKFNNTWQGFTLNWYRNLFDIPDLTDAVRNSLTLALLSATVATVLGTMIGMTLARNRFRGKGSVNLLLFSAIAAPEIALGAALLSLFITLGIPRGYFTLLIAHVMFSIGFVAVTVRARLAGFDESVVEAARDLGAGPWTAFRTVTLPLIWPGILAGGLLAYALSIDDFIITSFNSGQTLTFPLWVYGASRVGVPPQVNAMGTIIFTIGVVAAVANAVGLRRGRTRV